MEFRPHRWLVGPLLFLGLACGGGGVDTGKPFQLTETDEDAPLGSGIERPTLPPMAGASGGGGSAKKPAPPKTPAKDTDSSGSATPAEEAKSAAIDADDGENGEASPDDQGDGSADADVDADETEDTEDGGAMGRPGSDGESEAESEAEEEATTDEPDGTGPGQVLFLSASGVTPFLDNRQMDFVLVEQGFLMRSVSKGKHTLEIRNLMGQTVMLTEIEVRPGRRTRLRYRKREIEVLGYDRLD